MLFGIAVTPNFAKGFKIPENPKILPPKGIFQPNEKC
jgi:hypothetical protein